MAGGCGIETLQCAGFLEGSETGGAAWQSFDSESGDEVFQLSRGLCSGFHRDSMRLNLRVAVVTWIRKQRFAAPIEHSRGNGS